VIKVLFGEVWGFIGLGGVGMVGFWVGVFGGFGRIWGSENGLFLGILVWG